ncbi:MAG TPA: carbohydrate-binding family 9-like protein [Bacteroidales bacterium]|nr:carbohydrate-binding family 9-like protein [Bacteroidales bacterium]HPT03174.1 carbohydrate-binding family 9-like protein [Bacteroidales bacterium]
MNRTFLLIFVFSAFLLLKARPQEPLVPVQPRHYVCYRTSAPLNIDGKLNEADWGKAPWTEYFGDIEGSAKPEPRLKTRAKMLWDDNYLYVAAFLEEPHVWATLTERESVIFYDPDFEIFIDPDGDTHNYLEYEMNAFNTQWDLLITKPYRDDVVWNVAVDNWNYNGMKSGAFVDGTINNPCDTDSGWYVEVALPLDAISEVNTGGKRPGAGDQIRINFSRVEWTMDIVNGRYVKRTRLIDGKEKPLPEDNWVWSPQGVIAMHQPETWGFLQFSAKTAGSGTDIYLENPDYSIMQALRKLYFREKAWFGKNGSYTANLKSLGFSDYQVNGKPFRPEISLTKSLYEAVANGSAAGTLWHITQDGKIWKTVGK